MRRKTISSLAGDTDGRKLCACLGFRLAAHQRLGLSAQNNNTPCLLANAPSINVRRLQHLSNKVCK